MKSLPKRLSRFAAITCLGLAGSAVAVFAQTPATPGRPVATRGPAAPPPFSCAKDEIAFKVGNGTDDHFAGTVDPSPLPANQFAQAPAFN
jgi:hypothetical protein